MTRYLIAFFLLAAGGVLLITSGCDKVDEPHYSVKLVGGEVVTKSVSLNQGSDSAYVTVNFSWKGLPEIDGASVIVEKFLSGRYLVIDTISPVAKEMSFRDPEVMQKAVNDTFRYRLSLLMKDGRLYGIDSFAFTALKGISFDIADTISPVDKGFVLSWKPSKCSANCDAKLMLLEELVPVPAGKLILKKKVSVRDLNKDLFVRVKKEKLFPRENYVFEIKVSDTSAPVARTVCAYRVFTTGDWKEKED